MSLRKKKTKTEGGEEKKERKRSSLIFSFRRKSSASTEEGKTNSPHRASHDAVLPSVEPGWVRSSGSEAESDLEELGRSLMEALGPVLMGGTSGPPEQNPGSLLEAWGQKNPVPAPGQGSRAGRYPQLWLHQFQLQVQKSVERHFPSLPEGVSAEQQPPQPSTYLRQVQEVVQRELLRLAPVLKEAGLLGTVIDRYHTHTVSQLQLLLQENLDMNQTFTLLEWTLHTNLRDNMLRHAELAADVQVAADLLLLSQWIQKAKSKLLNVTEFYVAGCLQRILKMEEEEVESRDYSDEEAFIRLPLDVTQCLTSVARRAETVSRSLLGEIQRINLSQLHAFINRFRALERKHVGNGKGGVLHLFRTVNTYRELRLLAVQLASEAQTDAAFPAADAVNLLKELEAQATKQLLHTATRNTEVRLRSYFKDGDTHLQQLLSEMKSQFKNLPTECDTHKVVMDTVYSRIVSLYLEQLLLSNHIDLEKMWGEVGVVIKEDAEEMQKVFSQQNGGVEQKSELLLKAAEIVSCEDVKALKISCLELSTDYPDVSKKQLKKLLQWRGRLSSRQVKAVLEISHQGNRLPSWIPDITNALTKMLPQS
ncbi:exocyst complex component 3-like protein isoform X1 [Sardina pilchardus]|uniref:exocyst complex component 3-like protein isoform X1 n=1 Tax=Sardina pilchardus TaxID=27697 RepID=UPI002E0EBB05